MNVGGQDWIWGRLACLGKESVAHLGWQYPMANHQKARADYVIDAYLDPRSRTRMDEMDPGIFSRKDVFGLQDELARIEFPETPPLAMLLDSFADLTDQRFYRRGRGWSFCSHYSDLRDEELSDFEQAGLLPKELIPSVITGMVLLMRSIWPGVPLFYIHFPTALDGRSAFKERGDIISGALRRIQARMDGVFSIEVDPDLVAPDPHATAELRGFPYHFHPNVALDMAARIAEAVERRR